MADALQLFDEATAPGVQRPATVTTNAEPAADDALALFDQQTISPARSDRGLVNVPGESTPGMVSSPNPALQGMGFWSQQAGAGPAALAQHEAETIAESQVPGRELDVKSGIGSVVRARLGAERDKLQQLNILRDLFPDGVRMDKRGRWIVTKPDVQGKLKDVLVDEEAMTIKDLADVAHQAPALALSVLGSALVPEGKIAMQALGGAIGWAAGGGLTDLISRLSTSGRPIDPSEIATERGQEAIMNTAGGYIMGKGISLLGSLGKMLRMASGSADAFGEGASAAARARIEQARKATASTTGVTLEPTAGELTGNPIIQRLEAFFSNIPLARGFILKNIERRMANERAIQTRIAEMAGGDPSKMPSNIELGEQVLQAVGGKLQGLGEQAGELTSNLRREATESLTSPLARIPGQTLTANEFGTRAAATGDQVLQGFKKEAEQLFGSFRDLPEATDDLFNMASIKQRAADLKNNLVKDAGGDTEKAFAPAGILPQLDAIARQPSVNSYNSLVKLRSAIYDRMDSPEPISSQGTHLLKQLGAAITEQMEMQGPKVFGNKWQLVKNANKFYADNVESFYQKGISGLLRPRTDAGAIAPEQVAASIVAGGKGSVSTYNTFKDFFKGTGTVQDMNALLRDTLIDAGTDNATGLVNLADMAAGVSKMEPEIVQALYGTPKEALLKEVRQAQTALRVFGKAGAIPERGTQAFVESEALKDALAKGEVKSGTLKALASTTGEMQRTYTAELIAGLGRGDTRIIEAAPEKFVRDFLLNPATSEKAASNAMNHLMAAGDDQLLGDVRRFYLSELFKSGAASPTGDVQQLVSMQTGSPLRNLDPQKLAVIMEREDVQRRMNLILGPRVADAVREFVIALSGRAGKDAAATTTGSFAGGTYTHALLHVLGGKWGFLSALPDLAQYRVISFLLTHPNSIKGFGTMIGAAPEQLNVIAKAAVLTPEFANALAADSPTPREAAQVAVQVQHWATQKEKGQQVPMQLQAQ